MIEETKCYYCNKKAKTICSNYICSNCVNIILSIKEEICSTAAESRKALFFMDPEPEDLMVFDEAKKRYIVLGKTG